MVGGHVRPERRRWFDLVGADIHHLAHAVHHDTHFGFVHAHHDDARMAGGLARGHAELSVHVEHGHDFAAQIDDPEHHLGCARYPGYGNQSHDLVNMFDPDAVLFVSESEREVFPALIAALCVIFHGGSFRLRRRSRSFDVRGRPVRADPESIRHDRPPRLPLRPRRERTEACSTIPY